MLSEEEIQYLLLGIYSGKISVYDLPANLYDQIAKYLNKGWEKGVGDYILTKTMEEELALNIYLFSAAKTFQYVLSTQGLIVENGKIIPFNEFKVRAREVYGLFNETWLETEYITAIGQGENAALWNNINDHPEAGEFLKYDAVLDTHTSEICRPLDGIVKHKNDPFWSTYMPLNHYRCRCTVRQVKEEETNPVDVITRTQQTDKLMQDAFRGNAGKTGKVFSDDHPYFEVSPQYQNLARRNFNLPIPKKYFE